MNNDSIFEEFASRLFKPNNISVINIMENMAVFERPSNLRDDFTGTPSARNIFEISPQFITIFVAAFPDVYLWYLEESKNNLVFADVVVFQMKDKNKSLEQLIKEDPDFAIEYYSALVREFKDYKQLDELECSE